MSKRLVMDAIEKKGEKVFNAASGSKEEYSKTRSTEVIWFSTSADCRTPHWNMPDSSMAEEMASPMSPPRVSEENN
ncbi:hypothetical protein E2C01_049521 [Portunus trituberculatus]|uniref:Uncharacterized protein n=1 Tax=Portunus trituberculatus TaxID=210409 RepID=A0A5B7GDB7_PORTR|nr:hypothetical protein [Portunus trituberculatus]